MALSQRIYTINTLNKLTGTNQDFTYQFQIPQNENYDRVVVLAASIPNAFYVILDGYNSFTLRENGVDTKITITPGNYTSKPFATIVQALMNAASPNHWVYSMSLPNQTTTVSTGKYTFTVTGNSSQPSIICTANVNKQLGFQVNSTNTFVGNALTSTNTVDFSGESAVYIHSDIADNGDSDVLQEVFAGNASALSFITYQCTAPELYSKALRNNKSNIFHFSITDERNRLLDLHGVDMLLTISLYKKDDTNELIRKYIKYKVQADEPTN
jgi:hypothetical protein